MWCLSRSPVKLLLWWWWRWWWSFPIESDGRDSAEQRIKDETSLNDWNLFREIKPFTMSSFFNVFFFLLLFLSPQLKSVSRRNGEAGFRCGGKTIHSNGFVVCSDTFLWWGYIYIYIWRLFIEGHTTQPLVLVCVLRRYHPSELNGTQVSPKRRRWRKRWWWWRSRVHLGYGKVESVNYVLGGHVFKYIRKSLTFFLYQQ